MHKIRMGCLGQIQGARDLTRLSRCVKARIHCGLKWRLTISFANVDSLVRGSLRIEVGSELRTGISTMNTGRSGGRDSASDPSFWTRLVERVLSQPPDYWTKALSAKVIEVTRGKRGAITEYTFTDELCPAWIIKLRELPCLQDTLGQFSQPVELLRRTPGTEAFLGIKPFVRAELDTETNRPFLVRLGVRDTPAGPESILDCLRALAGLENPPINEVSKWYHRLDQLLELSSTANLQTLKDAFASSRLILTDNCGWASRPEVFLAPDDDAAPGAALVHPSARHLALWSKVGVAPQPTPDLAIAWLSGSPLWTGAPAE